MIFGILIWAVAMGLTLWGTWRGMAMFSGAPPHLDAPFALYPVSILKPLKGVDAGLETNLESFFALEYPDFELLFSVADAADPALRVVRRLIERHPRTRARIFIGETLVGANPKINNIYRAYHEARHDWVLISDSNVRVEPDYLKRLVAHLDPSVGMVTAVVCGTDGGGLGGALEAMILNTFYARGMCMSASVGRPCVVGKSMLFQRTTAKRFGGLKVLGAYLAEDYMAGEAMRKLGLRVVIARDAVRQVIGENTLSQFWARHIRWGRLRKTQAHLAFAVEPWFGPIVSGLLGAWAFRKLGVPVAPFIAIHLTTMAVCDGLLVRRLTGSLGASVKPLRDVRFPLYWFLRELLALPLWIHIASGNTVLWRGQRLRLTSGGILTQS